MANENRTHYMSTADLKNPSMPIRHVEKREFAERVFNLMREHGMTQAELSRAADLPRDSISRYVRAISVPDKRNLEKLARALGVAPEVLLPNVIEDEYGITESPLEIKVHPKDPTMAWVRINRLVPLSQVPALLQALDTEMAKSA